MKAINTPAARNRFVSLDLQGRSGESKLNRAAVKRGSRRQQRHQLNDALWRDLIADVAEGVAAYKRATAHSAVRTVEATSKNVQHASQAMALVHGGGRKATVIAFPKREITVTRKRPFHPAVVESLRLAA